MAVVDHELVGNIMYDRAKILSADGGEHPVLTFGPVSVLPKYQKQGIGSALINHSISAAREFVHLSLWHILLMVMVLAVSTVTLLGCGSPNSGMNSGADRPTPNEFEINRMLSQREMEEDLTMLLESLSQIHPATMDGFTPEQQTIIQSIEEKIRKSSEMSTQDFFFLINRLITSFKDAHTISTTILNGKTAIIDLPVFWLKDGFYVVSDTAELRKGDRLISIGDKNIEEVLRLLSKQLSTENEHWLKAMSRYMLYKVPYLEEMGLLGDERAVALTVQRDGLTLNVNLPVKQNVGFSFPCAERDWIGWTLDAEQSMGTLWMDRSTCNEVYEETLRQFFSAIRDNGIQNVVLDLRQNTGGVTSGLRPLLQYLGVTGYQNAKTLQRYSPQLSKKVPELKLPNSGVAEYTKTHRTLEPLADPSVVFHGDVYVLTSSLTFSAAHWYALVLQANDRALVVGEPTGNALTRYGDALPLTLPNSGIDFQVSTKRMESPEAAVEKALANAPITEAVLNASGSTAPDAPEASKTDAVYPDFPVFTTIDDILSGSDPQMEKVLELIGEKQVAPD